MTTLTCKIAVINSVKGERQTGKGRRSYLPWAFGVCVCLWVRSSSCLDSYTLAGSPLRQALSPDGERTNKAASSPLHRCCSEVERLTDRSWPAAVRACQSNKSYNTFSQAWVRDTHTHTHTIKHTHTHKVVGDVAMREMYEGETGGWAHEKSRADVKQKLKSFHKEDKDILTWDWEQTKGKWSTGGGRVGTEWFSSVFQLQIIVIENYIKRVRGCLIMCFRKLVNKYFIEHYCVVVLCSLTIPLRYVQIRFVFLLIHVQ